ncbi:non-specific serine/threonine protein kinase [Trifolium repens]|nr:non-specific serine/threonine protein kinase [Trifolium repens]
MNNLNFFCCKSFVMANNGMGVNLGFVTFLIFSSTVFIRFPIYRLFHHLLYIINFKIQGLNLTGYLGTSQYNLKNLTIIDVSLNCIMSEITLVMFVLHGTLLHLLLQSHVLVVTCIF